MNHPSYPKTAYDIDGAMRGQFARILASETVQNPWKLDSLMKMCTFALNSDPENLYKRDVSRAILQSNMVGAPTELQVAKAFVEAMYSYLLKTEDLVAACVHLRLSKSVEYLVDNKITPPVTVEPTETIQDFEQKYWEVKKELEKAQTEIQTLRANLALFAQSK